MVGVSSLHRPRGTKAIKDFKRTYQMDLDSHALRQPDPEA
jgi:hypothetical protein